MNIVSKCGIHSVGDDRHDYGPFLQTIAAAGRQLSLIKCRDSFGAVIEPLQLWPDILTIGAFTEFDRLPFDSAAFQRRALLNPQIKYWEVLNEDDSPVTYQPKSDLYISLAPMFKAHGWGCACSIARQVRRPILVRTAACHMPKLREPAST